MKLCVSIKCYVDRLLTRSKLFEKTNLDLVREIACVVSFETFIQSAIRYAQKIYDCGYVAGSYARMGLQSTWIIENKSTAYLYSQDASGTHNYYKLDLQNKKYQSISRILIPIKIQIYFNNLVNANLPTFGKKLCSNAMSYKWTPYEQKILELDDKYFGMYSSTFRLYHCDSIYGILRLFTNFSS